MTAVVWTRGGTALSVHAVEAMLARDITRDDVDTLLADPEQTYPALDGCTMHQRGDIAAVVTADRVVRTVLYRYETQWDDRDGRPSGRRVSNLARRRLQAELRRALQAATS